MSVENEFSYGSQQTDLESSFSRKLNKPNQSPLNFNDTVVIQRRSQKHLVMISETKLDFQEHLKYKVSRTSKKTGLLRKLNKKLTRNLVLTIYKSFIRAHLDSGGII